MAHADTDEIVLVSNATTALNTVLRNFEWREGDVIVLGNIAHYTGVSWRMLTTWSLAASTTYPSAADTARYLADRSEQPRPTIHTIEYSFPFTHAQVVDLFRLELRKVKQLHANTQFTDVPPASPNFVTDATVKKRRCECRREGVHSSHSASGWEEKMQSMATVANWQWKAGRDWQTSWAHVY